MGYRLSSRFCASWNPLRPIVRPPIKLWWSKSLPSAESGRVKKNSREGRSRSPRCFRLPLFRLPVLSVKVILTVRLLRWQAGCLQCMAVLAGFCLSTSFAGQYDGGNPAFICFHDSDAFISGGIIPAVFLPEAVTGLGKWMPQLFLMDAVKWMIKGGTALACVETCLNGRNCVCFIGSFEEGRNMIMDKIVLWFFLSRKRLT